MKTNIKATIVIILGLIFTIIYLEIDYGNLLTSLSIDFGKINIDLFSLFFTNLIVICLYLITYFMVDSKKQIERSNKMKIIKFMLIEDYKSCLRYLSILEDKTQLELIVKKIDTGDIFVKNDYFNILLNDAFKNWNDIMNFSSQGLIECEILEKYLRTKNNYSSTLTGYVLSSSIPAIEKCIEEGHDTLKHEIENEIDKVEKYKWDK